MSTFHLEPNTTYRFTATLTWPHPRRRLSKKFRLRRMHHLYRMRRTRRS